jgi:hypothetical protein
MKKLPIVVTVLTLLIAAVALAEPPAERTVIVAVADADDARVLVRWRTLEGIKRYDFYDVLRRDADDDTFSKLNALPVGALTDVASVEAVFTAPGRADALGWIQETLGSEYAGELLRLQGPDAPAQAKAQLVFLPDQNYGAALALGLGWLDETVTMGETYVYEVWGVDGDGFPVERLGRASATAGAPGALSAPPSMKCVESGGQQAHGAAFLRWEDTNAGSDYFFGYEVVRVPATTGTCPPDVLSEPGAVRASQYTVLPSSPGAVREGRELFELHCSVGCHVTRDDPVLEGGTLKRFRQLQNPDIAGLLDYPHNDTRVNSLSPDSVKKIFDYVYEFGYRDDGDDEPVVEGETYCYQTVPRDLLGQLHPAGPVGPCEVRDLLPPEVPSGIRSERMVDGNHEDCHISWDRNGGPEDDTAFYEVIRRAGDVPRNAYLTIDGATTIVIGTVPQPSAGERVSFTDPGMTVADATHRFFYAVRASDGSNTSPLTGWVPCVPRDIVPPPTPVIEQVACCDYDLCFSTADPVEFEFDNVINGYDPDDVSPPPCPPYLVVPEHPDAFRYRIYRSFNGDQFFAAEDVEPTECQGAGFDCLQSEFRPKLDQKVWYQVQAIDKSGNTSGISNVADFLEFGSAKAPAPKITEVWLSPNAADTTAPNGWIIVRFRALPPNSLLGFVLYKKYRFPNWHQYFQTIGPGTFVTRFHDDNLSETQPDPNTYPGLWEVKPGARTLDGILSTTPPGNPNPTGDENDYYLIYDPDENEYEMWVDVEETADIHLQLAAIGWTGHEGHLGGYTWTGYQANDDELDWPKYYDTTYLLTIDSDLQVNPMAGYNELRWAPPDITPDCFDSGETFVVFRQRNNSPNWKQISPLFSCFENWEIWYHDHDVEDGFCYSYVVVRLDEMGEFASQYGITTQGYPDNSACN